MYALEEYHSVQSKGENNLRPILYVRDPCSVPLIESPSKGVDVGRCCSCVRTRF